MGLSRSRLSSTIRMTEPTSWSIGIFHTARAAASQPNCKSRIVNDVDWIAILRSLLLQQPCRATCSSNAPRASSARSCACHSQSFKIRARTRARCEDHDCLGIPSDAYCEFIRQVPLSAQQALTPKILFELMESRTEDSITVIETLIPETTSPAAAARPGQPGGSSRREQQQRDTPDPVSAAFTRARLW